MAGGAILFLAGHVPVMHLGERTIPGVRLVAMALTADIVQVAVQRGPIGAALGGPTVKTNLVLV